MSSLKQDFDSQLVYRPYNGLKDQSDILRGKIICLEEVLGLKDVFDKFDKAKKEVEEHEKGAK